MERKLPRGERKRIAELVCGDSIRPLTKAQTEWIRKDSAKFIHFANKDRIHGYCDRCESEVEFEMNTKHNAKVRCPHCKHEMTVRHSWRGSTEDVDFRVVVKVLGDNRVLYRYVLVTQKEMDRGFCEVARQVDDFEYFKSFYYEEDYEYVNGEKQWFWTEGRKHQWFTEYTMNYGERRFCVLKGKVVRLGLKKELRKLEPLKYIENTDKFIDNRWYVCGCIYQLTKYANIYEKLQKVGQNKFAVTEFKNWLGYYGTRESYGVYDEKQTSLIKILKLDKNTYKEWQKYGTLNALKYLQKYPTIKDEVIDYVLKNDISLDAYTAIKQLRLGKELKTLRYLKRNDVVATEYSNYINVLKKLGYPIDNSYMFPKDFEKENKRVHIEYDANKSELDTKYNNKLIKQISDGLRNMKELKTFLDGSKGLLVYVPDSVADLKEEGRALHNCIGTYVDRVAEGKTFVFFVRRLDNPTAPFVAFEYCNGEVIQCRSDHNQNVVDNNVLDFVDAFADKLRKANALAA